MLIYSSIYLFILLFIFQVPGGQKKAPPKPPRPSLLRKRCLGASQSKGEMIVTHVQEYISNSSREDNRNGQFGYCSKEFFVLTLVSIFIGKFSSNVFVN